MVIQQRQSIQSNIKRHYPHGEEIVVCKLHIKLFKKKEFRKKNLANVYDNRTDHYRWFQSRS